MTTRRNLVKISSKRAALFFVAAGLVTASGLVEACGLDDTVVDVGPSGGSTPGDATIGGDGSSASRDGSNTLTDSGPKLLPDGAIDPGDDAAVALDSGDASFPDATASDGGSCPSGQSQCGSGTSATCVTDCTAQCSGSGLSCNKSGGAVCVADCTSCGGSSAECYRCEIGTGFAPSGTCEDPGSSSSCVQNSGYLHCACFGYNLSSCPGATQVCRPTLFPGVGVCKTCGESNTKANDCKGGDKCDTKNDTCH